MLHELTKALGYREESRLYFECEPTEMAAPSDLQSHRAAKAAGVHGTYYFRTSEHTMRPAVHVAEVPTRERARELHQILWNQGLSPFLLVLMPGEVRAYSGFAYHPDKEEKGRIEHLPLEPDTMSIVVAALSSFSAQSIDSGEIWSTQGHHLRPDTRVDATLLKQLRILSQVLQDPVHDLDVPTSHALIGKFIYLHYLRARNILSDQWLDKEAQSAPRDVFSREATLAGFQRVIDAVEQRFNGDIFKISWTSGRAPKAAAVRLVAAVFMGDTLGGQLHLPFNAYNFASIPIELLSAIYEQFLHVEGTAGGRHGSKPPSKSSPDLNGAHYTPELLAEYVVDEVDSIRPLRLGMRILDPCCGSGIFLVIAYRRLIEQHIRTLPDGSKPKPSDLREILSKHIYGVERNRTACQLAAFSLILTMLSYVDPPELHRNQQFRFPSLIDQNLFDCDFFDNNSKFWELQGKAGGPITFDWILGNPPWVELDPGDPKEAPILDWYGKHKKDLALARLRTGEAFAWRVLECLGDQGTVGLILAAKTLTNDQLERWRKRFFAENSVWRITNLSNLAYVIFASADAPTITLVYSKLIEGGPRRDILHVGPFVAHQLPLQGAYQKRAWTIAVTESEIKAVGARAAASGEASVWKLALWGNLRDERALSRIALTFNTTLGDLVERRKWHLGLGLQLRSDQGTEEDPNEYVASLEGLMVLDHRALVKLGPRLEVPDDVLVENKRGCYVREGRLLGVALVEGPHLFLWNEYAAFSKKPFIIKHDKIGIAAPDEDEDFLRAIAVIWSSSISSYFLFWRSAAWGIDRSQIDLGDARGLPLPPLKPSIVTELASVHRRLARQTDFQARLDDDVARALALPDSIAMLAREFREVRLHLNKGKSPEDVTRLPTHVELESYAVQLRRELDTFLANRTRHRITVMYTRAATAVTVEITDQEDCIPTDVREATGENAAAMQELLKKAEIRFSQWMYVKRSVRIFEGRRVHIVKPPRRLEWTRTQATLDAADLITEIARAM